MEPVALRLARAEDAPALLEIYAPYVRETPITFEYEVPGAEEFGERIRATLQRYPYLVAEQDGRPVGYAYASAFQERAAYSWAAETSIYVRQGLHGKGVGRMLYEALERALRAQHVLNLNACITYPNPKSIAFHERFGYHTAAHFSKCGFKLGAWWDMVWMEKLLGEHETPPAAFLPFPSLLEQAGGREEQNSSFLK